MAGRWFVRPLMVGLAFAVSASAMATDSLTRAIDEVTRRPAVRRAVWGVVVENASGILYEKNADTLMTPASVRKLFAAASAINCHGADGRLQTTISLTAQIESHGVLRGDVVLKGGADPTLGGRWEYDSDRFVRLRPAVEALHQAGLRQIEGDIVVDVSLFADDTIPGSWKADNLGNSWAAPVDAIAFNENVIGVSSIRGTGRQPRVKLDPAFPRFVVEDPCSHRVGGAIVGNENAVLVECSRTNRNWSGSWLAAVDDPALFAGQAFRALLAEYGIHVRGIRVVREAPLGARLIVEIPSPPIGALLGPMLTDSANLYAEMLFKTIGASEGVPSSYARSLEVERGFLVNTVGIDAEEFSFDDGSGLSPENAVTPRATIRLLKFLRTDHGRAKTIEQALATPGTGTLRKRLEGFEGRVFAKTGSIDGVNGLAGWVLAPDGELRYFAIYINHHRAGSTTAKKAIDDIVRAIADYRVAPNE